MLASVSRSPLPPAAYHDDRVAERERELVFERHWVFAGLTDDLPADGDSVALPVGRESVLVVNVKGEVRAFRNVCTHRGARLRPHGRGHGPVRCAYHGWTYDGNGVPTGIPNNRELFGCTDEDRAGLALRRFRATAAGRFLFVRVGDEGLGLEEFLGPDLWDLLTRLSALPLVEFTTGTEVWAGNWKLAVENTLEPYHTGFVHRDSLTGAVAAHGDHRTCGDHSSSAHDLLPPSREWWAKVVARSRLSGLPGVCHYSHHFIYPNLCLGLTYGALLSLQQFDPLGPAAVRLTYRLFLPELPGPVPDDIRRTVREYLTTFNRQVLDEDRAPVELCQLGTAHGARPAWLGATEVRVGAFHQAIARDLGGVLPVGGHT